MPPIKLTTIITTSRRRLIAIAAMLALGTGAGADAASASDAPAPKRGTTDSGVQLSSVDSERVERQKPLIAAADVIKAAVDDDTRTNPRSGYSSIALGERSVVLRWKGTLPRAVEAAVDQARGDVAVEVVGARHTNAQLQAKAALIQRATTKLAGGVPFAVSIPIEGDKVRLEVEGDVITRVKTGLPALDLPIEVTYADVPEPASRLADSAPFYGGARIRNNWNGGACSIGFAVTHWSGGSYVVTAGHCGHPGLGFSNGDRTRSVGSASQEHVYFDLLLIPTSSAGRIYSGRSGDNSSTIAANGWNYVYPNEWMCTSGSFTGEVCGVQADTSSAYGYCSTDSHGTYECYGEMFRAYQRAGLRAVQRGDSGGPVYNYHRNAMGIISGGNSSGTTVVFQDFYTVNQIWGVVPK